MHPRNTASSPLFRNPRRIPRRLSRVTVTAAAATAAAAVVTGAVAAGITGTSSADASTFPVVHAISAPRVVTAPQAILGPAHAAQPAAVTALPHTGTASSAHGQAAASTRLTASVQQDRAVVARQRAAARQQAAARAAQREAAAKAAPKPAAPARPAAPAQPYKLYDSVTPSAVPSHQPVAVYSNGSYAASPSQLTSMGTVTWIDVTGYNYTASVLDVEPGDATPAQAANWAWHRLHADPGTVARIYTMLSQWPSVQAAVKTLPGWMQARVHYWIADPTGVPHLVPGSQATQWYWGPNYDVSTALPWF